MKVKKLLKNSLRYVPQVLVLFSVLTSNVFFPALAIAQELSDLPESVEQSIDIPVIDDSEDILEDGISTSIYEEGIYTVHTVVENQEYVYPDNVDVRVMFNEVSEDGNLVIKRVVLSEEEKSSLNTSDDYGWDITSSMSNGSFNYDLTLPNTQGDDVEVKYTEDGSTYESVEGVVNEDVIVLRGLEHFTVFVVTKDEPALSGTTCVEAGATSNSNCYNTIQAAINAAASGNVIIIVKPGTYTENIIVDKENLTIKSSDGATQTIIDGNNTNSPIFKVTKNNVTIEGFTIQNASNYYGAIHIYNSLNSVIKNNLFLNNGGDIFVEKTSNYTTVVDNTLKGTYSDAESWAIFISDADYNVISGNTITGKNNSNYSAIHLEYSNNNEISENTMTDNINIGGVFLTNQSKNNTVSGNQIINNNNPIDNGSGIELNFSNNNTLVENTIKKQNTGIRLSEASNNNKVEGNTLTENHNGIRILTTGGTAGFVQSINNTIMYNKIFENDYNGIDFQGTENAYGSNSTIINYNNIYENEKGIYYKGNDALNAKLNWWGQHTGPSVTGPSSSQGNSIDSNITYQEWLCEPYSTEWVSQNGVCSIEAPTTLGRNVSSLTSNPGETPTKLSCGSYTNDNTPSHVWSAVDLDGVLYQREAKTPSGGWWTDPAIYTDTHTPFVWFGNAVNGVEGEWDTRVRAWKDINSNGVLDNDDLTSVWSNGCKITYDKTAPTAPSTQSLHYEIDGEVLSCGSYTQSYDVIAQWNDSSDTNGVDHYEYQSFNPTTGWIWPNANYGVEVPTSQRAGAFTVGEGTYGFRVRAVDKAGNKSEWTSSNFENSCQITYDKTGPVVTLTSPIDNYYTNQIVVPQTWTTTDTDVASYEYRSCSNDPSSETCNVIYSETRTKQSRTVHNNNIFFWWQVRGIDNVGNVGEWSQPRKITIDTIAPVVSGITITKDGNPVTYVKAGDIIKISATVIDQLSNVKAVSADFSYNSPYTNRPTPRNTGMTHVSGDTYEAIFTIPVGWNEGDLYVTVAGLDNVDNYDGNRGLARILVIDNAAPSGTIEAIKYPALDVSTFITNDNAPTIIGTMDDSLSGIESVTVSINGTTGTVTQGTNNWKAVFTTTLPDGTYTISLVVKDKAGNTAPETTKSITIDTVAPYATHTYLKDGVTTTDTTYVKRVNQLSFTAQYFDEPPSSGMLQDSFVIFDSNQAGTARTSKAYCGWRSLANTPMITGYSITTPVQFTDCEPTLPDGGYFMYHQVYDKATRKDIPSITQFRDVKGLHFIVDAQAPTVAITNPSSGTVSDIVDFRGTVGDDNLSSYSYEISGLANVTSSTVNTETGITNQSIYSWNTTTYPNGAYQIKLKATDKAGNETEEVINVTVNNQAEGEGQVAGAATTNPSLLNTVRTAVNKIFGTNTGTGSGSEILAETQETILEETQEDEEVLGEETITCENPKPIKGYVYLDKNKNDKKDDKEKGIENVSIRIYTIYEGNEITIAQLKTDEYGYWQSDICPGDYSIEIDQESLPKNLETEEILSVNVIEEEQEITLNIPATDTRNFWQKYWYIILILSALLLTTAYVVVTRKNEGQYNQ